jgi:endoglucanase
MLLARQVLREETAMLPGLGRTLLPGPEGFHPKLDLWRLNPSYAPLQVMRRLAAALPDEPQWKALIETSARLIIETAPHGFAPEWAEFQAGQGFRPDTQTRAEGSYNAIRVYLWAGMLSAADPLRQTLLDRFRPMAAYVAARGAPPEHVNTQAGTSGPNDGNAGFSAAIAPLLQASGKPDLAGAQTQRMHSLAAKEPPDYYSQVLSLFGIGYLDGLYRFEADGRLVPAWIATCPAAR